MTFKIAIVLLLIPIFNFSQTLTGTIIDSVTNETLPLANITLLKGYYGTNSNLEGIYTLNLKGHVNDSLKVSYVGYQSNYVSLDKFIENKQYVLDFRLTREVNKLQELVIAQSKTKYTKKIKLKENRVGDIAMFSLIGHETACLVENPLNELGRIKSLKLYVRKNRSADFIAKWRIKIYAYDKATNKPTDPLLAADLIISPKNKTYQYVIDLADKKIPFLADGVCVGIELVDENNSSKKGDKIGPGFRFTYGESKQLTWYNYRNSGWAKNNIKNRSSNSMSNLLVSMTVLMQD
jgi:hypothetical protein